MIFLLTAICAISLCACSFLSFGEENSDNGNGTINGDNNTDNGNNTDDGNTGSVYKQAGTYEAGQYKVGDDIPAGTYTLHKPSGNTIMTYKITTLPVCNILDDAMIEYSLNLTADKSVTLTQGRYIVFNQGSLTAA